MLPIAVREDADAFVTADVKYHALQEAENRIALIDAGHFETEHPAVDHVADYLRKKLRLRRERVKVSVSRFATNPVQYHCS